MNNDPEIERLWAAVETLTELVGDLWKFSLSKAKDEEALVPLQRCLKQFDPLLTMIGEPRAGGAGPSIDELHSMIQDLTETIEEREAEREADRQRPVHVRVIRSGANE